MSDDSQITNLRSQLQRARQDRKREEKLQAERLQYEEELDALLNENPFPSGEDHEEQIQQRQERIKNIRKQLMDIDHEIDQIGEDLPTTEDEIKFELTSAILANFPDHQPQHSEWVAGQQKMRELLAICQRLRTECGQIEGELGQADRLWEKAKNRSWFHRIFGANPTVVVASHMEKAGHAAMRALGVLTEYERYGPLQGVINDLRELFKEMGEVADSRWGFKSMEKTVHPFYHRFHKAFSDLSAIEERGERELLALDEEVEKWLGS